MNIVHVYAWVDGMPKIGSAESRGLSLMCSTEFNVNTDTFEVEEIVVHNEATKEGWKTDSSVTVDGFRYEKRDEEIILRNGPSWKSSTPIHITAKCKMNGQTFEMQSKSVKINYVC